MQIATYAFRVPERSSTSRSGRRYREADPNAPTALFTQRVLAISKLTPSDLAKKLEVTNGLMTQYVKGQTHPSAAMLLEMSGIANLSLGYLSAIAASKSHARPKLALGEFEGRLAALPDFLRSPVIKVLEQCEQMAIDLPFETKTSPVSNQRLEELGWTAPKPPRSRSSNRRRGRSNDDD